jgi:hypothetical protein
MSLDLNSTRNIWEVYALHSCVLRYNGGHRWPAFLLQAYIMSPACSFIRYIDRINIWVAFYVSSVFTSRK